MGDEIERAELLKVLTPEQVALLFPEYPEDHPVIVNKIGEGQTANVSPDFGLSTFDFGNISLDSAAYQRLFTGPGSWSARRWNWLQLLGCFRQLTDTGTPYLANDPHLGIQMPSIWYQVG